MLLSQPGVVNREVCSVTTVGTRTFCYLDSNACFEANSKFKEEVSISESQATSWEAYV